MPKEPKKRNSKVAYYKQKGREFAQRVCAAFVEAFRLNEEEARCAVGYEIGCDVKFLERAQKIVGLYIEAKNQNHISLGSWLAQALANTPEGETPALIFHKSIKGRSRDWIVVPLEHYLEVRAKLRDYEILDGGE